MQLNRAQRWVVGFTAGAVVALLLMPPYRSADSPYFLGHSWLLDPSARLPYPGVIDSTRLAFELVIVGITAAVALWVAHLHSPPRP